MKKHNKKNDKKHSKSSKSEVKKITVKPETKKALTEHLFEASRANRMVELANRWLKDKKGDIETYAAKIKSLLPSGSKDVKGSGHPFGVKFQYKKYKLFYGISGNEYLVWRPVNRV